MYMQWKKVKHEVGFRSVGGFEKLTVRDAHDE